MLALTNTSNWPIRTLVLSAVFLSAFIASAPAATIDECIDNETNNQIKVCTRIINSKTANKKQLPALYVARGKARTLVGMFDAAITDFTAAIKIDPFFHAAYAGMGRTWFRAGYENRAIAAYSKAIAQAPKMAEYYYARAGVYMEEIYAHGKIAPKRKKLLIADLHKVLKLDPTHKGAKADLKSLGIK